MDEQFDPQVQRWLVWTGPAFMLSLFVGFGLFAGWIPPPPAYLSAAELAQLFRENATNIRIGMIISIIGSSLFIGWFVALAVQLKRVEGKYSPIAYAQLVCGAIVVIEFLFPLTFWEAAVFRLERSDEAIQSMNDLAWFPFLAQASLATFQIVLIGVAILRDKRADPIFPRWAGFFNIWVALLLLPGDIIVFFKKGPLAWDGLLSWWMVLTAYFLWLLVDTVLLFKAINRQEREVAALFK